jgi:hypothetical protein
MDAEETAFPALDALDDLPKLNPELVAWANRAAAITAEAAERRRSGRGLAFASCLLLLAGSAAAETTVRLSGGLKGEVIQMGREGRVLTLAMKITNESKDADAFILLFGEPSAFDDAGGRWNIVQAVTGVAYCPGPFTSPPTFRLCVGIPRVTETLFPMQGYTDIQPGQSVTVHYQFTGGGEKGERISLAHDLAYRFATAEKDAGMSDAQKLKALRFGSLSYEFTQKEVVTSSIKFGDVVK